MSRAVPRKARVAKRLAALRELRTAVERKAAQTCRLSKTGVATVSRKDKDGAFVMFWHCTPEGRVVRWGKTGPAVQPWSRLSAHGLQELLDAAWDPIEPADAVTLLAEVLGES